MMTTADQHPWYADERRLYLRRLQTLLKGDTVRFPNRMTVVRGDFTYEVYQGSKTIRLAEIVGQARTQDQRIEKIVDWIIERTNQMDTITLTSTQLLILSELFQRGESKRSKYDENDLDNLFEFGFIRDVHPARIVLTPRGEAYLLPHTEADKERGAPPTLSQLEPESPAPTAALVPQQSPPGRRKPTPAANGVIGPKTLLGLIAVARAGGELERSALHHFTVDKLLLEGLIEEVGTDRIAITPKGVLRLDEDDARQAATGDSVTGNTPPENTPQSAAIVSAPPSSAVIPSPQRHAVDCEDCVHKRILEALMEESPLVRRSVERMIAHDMDMQRLRSLD